MCRCDRATAVLCARCVISSNEHILENKPTRSCQEYGKSNDCRQKENNNNCSETANNPQPFLPGVFILLDLPLLTSPPWIPGLVTFGYVASLRPGPCIWIGVCYNGDVRTIAVEVAAEVESPVTVGVLVTCLRVCVIKIWNIGVRGGRGGGGGHCAPPPPIIWKPEIRAKFGRKFGQKYRGTNIKKRQKKKSGKFTKKEMKISCIFKSMKLFENNSQELARISV